MASDWWSLARPGAGRAALLRAARVALGAWLRGAALVVDGALRCVVWGGAGFVVSGLLGWVGVVGLVVLWAIGRLGALARRRDAVAIRAGAQWRGGGDGVPLADDDGAGHDSEHGEHDGDDGDDGAVGRDLSDRSQLGDYRRALAVGIRS